MDMRNKTKRRQNRRLERESVAGRFSEERLSSQVDTIWPHDARRRVWFVYIFSFFRVVSGYVKRRGRSGVTKNFFEREVIRIIHIHAFRLGLLKVAS